jgi:hypothetical protein
VALHTDDPFAMECQVDPWVAFLIPLCNGQATVRQLWQACKAESYIQAETSTEEFARLIAVLISGGFLEVAEHRPPNAPAEEKAPASVGPQELA